MQLDLASKREQHIVSVALAFLKRNRLTSDALKVDFQLTEDAMDYRQISEKEINSLLEKMGIKY